MHCVLVVAVWLVTVGWVSAGVCLNGGTPISHRDFCECPRPFDGDYCQRLSPCGMNGVVGAGFKCVCDENWTGENCTERQCKHGGHLDDEGHCVCPSGYTSHLCELVDKCVNGQLTDGRCRCDENWESDFCDRVQCDSRMGMRSSDNRSCLCWQRREGIACRQCVYPFYGADCQHEKWRLFLSFDMQHWVLLGLLLPLLLTACCCCLLYCCCCRRDLDCIGSYRPYSPPKTTRTVHTSTRGQLRLLQTTSSHDSQSNGMLTAHDNHNFVALGPKNAGVAAFPLDT